MRRLINTVILLCGFLLAQANGLEYNSKLIPDSLKKDANAVVRSYNKTYTRTSIGAYTVDVNYVITVLNKKGDVDAELTVYYDRNCSVSNIAGYFYDKNGNTIGKLKSKDVNDDVSNASFTLFSDNRVKSFAPAINSYPYTIEYSYRLNHNGVVGFTNWVPSMGYNVSVENANLRYISESDIGVKFLELNHDFNRIETEVKGKKIYEWNISQFKALKYQPWSPDIFDFMPCVLLSPNSIVYEKTRGDFNSWNSYGKWVYGLIENTDELPEETIAEIYRLIEGLGSDREKIRVIYEYVQAKTRYVNIALGIGGFKPIEATLVDQKGYGDCKALSNYTRSLLKSAGIESYYAEIGSGTSRSIKYPNFASANQTNHIILCVPNKQDTIWLECTSQNIPFGYIGTGNTNKLALLIKPEGGELVQTVNTESFKNIRASKVAIDVNLDGSATVLSNYEFYNYSFDEIRGLYQLSKAEQEKYLYRKINSKGFSIMDFDVCEQQNDTLMGSITFSGHLSSFATKLSQKIIVKPELYFRNKAVGTIAKDRILPIKFPNSIKYSDTLSIRVPLEYKFTTRVDTTVFSSDYGNYQLIVKRKDNDILIERYLNLNGGTYTKSQFANINDFLRKIRKGDGMNYVASEFDVE